MKKVSIEIITDENGDFSTKVIIDGVSVGEMDYFKTDKEAMNNAIDLLTIKNNENETSRF